MSECLVAMSVDRESSATATFARERIAFFAVALTTCGILLASAAFAQSDIEVGVLLPLSGPMAAEGRRQLNGLEVMREVINERGGIAGRKLGWVVGDAADPTAAINEASRLIAQQGVRLIIGTYSSSLCVPASDVAARRGIIYWEVSCVDPRFTKRGYSNVYRTEINAAGFGWYTTEFIRTTLASRLGKDPRSLRIAFVSEDSAYGQGSTEAAASRAKAIGFKVVSVDYYNRNAITDFAPIILKLKASKPDVVHAQAYTNDAILFWKQARQLDLNVGALVSAGATGFGSPDFGRNLGRFAEGPFVLDEPGGINMKTLSSEAAAMEELVARRYAARYGGEMIGGAAQLGAAGLWILSEVLRRTDGDLDPDRFRQAVMSLDIPVGGMLNGWGVKFGADGQNANDRVQHYMLQWQDGKLVTVWPEKFAVAPLKRVPLPPWRD